MVLPAFHLVAWSDPEHRALHFALRKIRRGDEFGNRYYRSRKIDEALGVERRWVIFSGESDGSMQPPGWYGWVHHTVATPPTQEKFTPPEWQKPFQPNFTG